jgi:hypothetical protein
MLTATADQRVPVCRQVLGPNSFVRLVSATGYHLTGRFGSYVTEPHGIPCRDNRGAMRRGAIASCLLVLVFVAGLRTPL